MNRALFFVCVATVFFSSMEIALKQIVDAFSAMQVNTTRFLLGGLALIPFALRDLRRGEEKLTLAAVARMAALGLLGIVVSMGFYQLAVELAPASVVAVIFCGNTAFVLFFAHIFLKSPIARNQIAALVLAILGIVCILWPFASVLRAEALVYAVLAPATFALYAVLSTPLCRRYSGVVVTCGTFLLGSAELLVLVFLADLGPVAAFLQAHGMGFLTNVHLLSGYTFSSFLGMLYVGIGVSGIGFATYFMAAEVGSPFTASLVFFFKPVLAPILAWALLDDTIPPSMLLGIACIVAGSLCLILVRLRDLRLVRTMQHWQRLYHHKRWRHDYRIRHFDPHLLAVVHRDEEVQADEAKRG